MPRLRFTLLFLSLSLITAGPLTAQQRAKPLSPISLALKLSSQLDKESYEYRDASRAISRNYWQRAKYDAALSQLKTLDSERQAEALYHLLKFEIRPGQQELATRVLEQALAVLQSNPEEAADSHWTKPFVMTAVEFDRLELASGFIALFDADSAKKSWALFYEATGFAKRGEKEKALALFDESVEQFARFGAEEQQSIPPLTSLIAEALAKLNQRERAVALLDRTRVLVASGPGFDDSDAAIIALAYAKIGDLPKASTLLATTDNPRHLISLATAYKDNGQDALALMTIALAQGLVEVDDHFALGEIARAYMDVGHPHEALEIMRTMNYSYEIRETSIALAKALDRNGRREDALAALDFAFSHHRKLISEKSEDIPARASRSVAGEKSQALVAFMKEYLELGDLRRAEQAAREIDQPQYRASALALVAVASLKTKDNVKAKLLLDQALKLSTSAEPYSHDLRRHETLFTIAESYAQAGFKREAADVVVRFIRELQGSDFCCQAPITQLLELGQMAETNGIPLDKSTQKALQQLEKGLEEDQ